MTRRNFPIIAGALFCLGAFTAYAQNYNTEPPPAAPPPSDYYFFTPEGAGPYFRAGAGPSFFQDGRLTQFGGPANNTVQYDAGAAVNAAVGYAFNKFFAMDFETGYIGARIRNVPGYFSDNSTIENVPLLFNGVISIPNRRNNVVPYFGAGVGPSVSVFDTDGFSDGSTTVFGRESDTVFALQVFAGLRFMINPEMSLGFGYKYFATGDPTFSYPPGPNFDVGFKGVRTHSVLFTFEWMF